MEQLSQPDIASNRISVRRDSPVLNKYGNGVVSALEKVLLSDQGKAIRKYDQRADDQFRGGSRISGVKGIKSTSASNRYVPGSLGENFSDKGSYELNIKDFMYEGYKSKSLDDFVLLTEDSSSDSSPPLSSYPSSSSLDIVTESHLSQNLLEEKEQPEEEEQPEEMKEEIVDSSVLQRQEDDSFQPAIQEITKTEEDVPTSSEDTYEIQRRVSRTEEGLNEMSEALKEMDRSEMLDELVRIPTRIEKKKESVADSMERKNTARASATIERKNGMRVRKGFRINRITRINRAMSQIKRKNGTMTQRRIERKNAMKVPAAIERKNAMKVPAAIERKNAIKVPAAIERKNGLRVPVTSEFEDVTVVAARKTAMTDDSLDSMREAIDEYNAEEERKRIEKKIQWERYAERTLGKFTIPVKSTSGVTTFQGKPFDPSGYGAFYGKVKGSKENPKWWKSYDDFRKCVRADKQRKRRERALNKQKQQQEKASGGRKNTVILEAPVAADIDNSVVNKIAAIEKKVAGEKTKARKDSGFKGISKPLDSLLHDLVPYKKNNVIMSTRKRRSGLLVNSKRHSSFDLYNEITAAKAI